MPNLWHIGTYDEFGNNVVKEVGTVVISPSMLRLKSPLILRRKPNNLFKINNLALRVAIKYLSPKLRALLGVVWGIGAGYS